MSDQSVENLKQQLADKLAEVELLQKELAARGKKRARPELTGADDEKSAEPVAKKRKLSVEPEADESDLFDDAEFSDNEVSADEDAEMEDVIADGTHVAVMYGHLNGLEKRKWYAATVKSYNDEKKTYTVDWKYPPRSWAKKTVFTCEGSRLREITEDDYKNAPHRGTGYVGLHRAETFKMQEEEPASDAESEEETEGVQVGDYVAVAWGPSRANKKGNKSSDLKARNTKKYHKRFLWYAATVIAIDSDDVTVEWKHPFSKKESDKHFMTTQEKVQPITKKEFKQSRKIAKGKKMYGFMGIHRLQTKAGLTTMG